MAKPALVAVQLQTWLRDKRWVDLCQIDHKAREVAASQLWPHSMGNSGETPDGERVFVGILEELLRG